MKWKVTSEESGTKLLAFLKSKLGNAYSARQLKRAIESNCCLVNDRVERFASAIVGRDDRISIRSESLINTHPLLVFETQRVLYETADYLIYNKPAGIASDNPEFICNIKRKIPYLQLAHRLDKETTGVLMFAKSEKALSAVTALFRKRLINKQYLAIVDGIPIPVKGVIDNYLGPLHRYEGQTLWGKVSPAKGQHAITAWECECKGNNAALVRCYPKTGRTHQLRVHLKSIGHPILGDYQYTREFKCSYRPPHLLLHAESLTFECPITGKTIHVSAPLPDVFREAMQELFSAR